MASKDESNLPSMPAFRPYSPNSAPPAEWDKEDGILSKEERRERNRQIKVHTQAQIREAKRQANVRMPPPEVSIFASSVTMGYHFGVGMGLYFQVLEWLIILFACITFLSIPFWIVINGSVFTDKANRFNQEVGVKVFEEPSLLGSTFASIVDFRLDPNNTLVYMNTELGSKTYGPMEKDDFLLFISLLDVVAVVLAIGLVTFYTWKSYLFEEEVDKNTYDATDYTVLVTGLPPDAGFHEIGHFFSRFGEVMDVTLILDMECVLKACAKASRLEHKRALQSHYMRMLPLECKAGSQKRMEEIEDELIVVLKEINADMDKQIEKNKKEKAKGVMFKNSLGSMRRQKIHDEAEEERDVENTDYGSMHFERHSDNAGPKGVAEAAEDEPHIGNVKPKMRQSSRKDGFYKGTFTQNVFKREAVYDTKAAFVTFNRMSEQQECLKLTPNPGFSGWLYSHTVSKSAQCIRGFCIQTRRAENAADYIFENMCLSKNKRFWRRLLIRFLYLVMLIACALIVSALSSRTRVEINRKDLAWLQDEMSLDIGTAGNAITRPENGTTYDDYDTDSSTLKDLYESAMRDVTNTPFNETVSFSTSVAEKANFTEYCQFALPGTCTNYYEETLPKDENILGLIMNFGKHFQWLSVLQQGTYLQPLLTDLKAKAGAPPAQTEGKDIGLTSCLPCYCYGLSLENTPSANKSGTWLATSQQHCISYLGGTEVQASTETGISVVIVVLNVLLKVFVKVLASLEMRWTRSEMEKSFCIVAYLSQLLNSVLVVIIVNARPNAKIEDNGDRVDEDNISWLRYIILGGSFDDISSGWYEYVGQSFIILLFIQLIIPFLNILIEHAIQWLKQCLVKARDDATQDDFNNAYDYPLFLLQQRVADVMLNVSVALLFCSGMPLCAGVVVLVFSITNIVDRWALVSLEAVNRYGSQLPNLILGLLPFAVFFHCCFGLWMHTYFMSVDPDSDSKAIFITNTVPTNTTFDGTNQFGTTLDKRTIGSRISQPNGFGLLILAFIMFIWLIYRYILVEFLNPMIRQWINGKEQQILDESEEDGIAYMNKAGHKLLRKIMSMPKAHIPGQEVVVEEEDDEPTFEEALLGDRLQGLPTFRLPFHPRYADIFSGLLHGPIWGKMLGPYRYTRIVPTKEDELLSVYHVTVKTSDIFGAGTDCDVLLTMFGEKDGKAIATRPQDLDSAGDSFERGNEDKVTITARDVGDIKQVQVRSCGRGFGAAWHLESLTVTDALRGTKYFFPCGEWLDPTKKKSLIQKLTPTQISEADEEFDADSKANGKAWIDLNLKDEHDDGDATDAPDPVEAMQRQSKLHRAKLGWMVSPTLILDAAEATLDTNISDDLEQKGAIGPKLAAFVAELDKKADAESHPTSDYARAQLQNEQNKIMSRTRSKRAVGNAVHPAPNAEPSGLSSKPSQTLSPEPSGPVSDKPSGPAVPFTREPVPEMPRADPALSPPQSRGGDAASDLTPVASPSPSYPSPLPTHLATAPSQEPEKLEPPQLEPQHPHSPAEPHNKEDE